jgi:hypothetical protein
VKERLPTSGMSSPECPRPGPSSRASGDRHRTAQAGERPRMRWRAGGARRRGGIGRTAIGEYVRRAAVIGITWPVPEELDDAALERTLFAPSGYNPPRSNPLPEWGHTGCKRLPRNRRSRSLRRKAAGGFAPAPPNRPPLNNGTRQRPSYEGGRSPCPFIEGSSPLPGAAARHQTSTQANCGAPRLGSGGGLHGCRDQRSQGPRSASRS